jgi:hypothetical protein
MMSRFIIRLLLFLLPVLLIGLVSEIALRNIPNDYYYKKDFLDKNSGSIKTLFLGNSHCYYDLDPVYFSVQTFSAAYISQSLYFDYRIMEKYDGRWDSLETIVITATYAGLFNNLESSIEAWRTKNYIIYYGFWSSNKVKDYFEIFSNNYEFNKLRFKSYYLDNVSPVTCSKRGWGTEYKSTIRNDLYQVGKTAAERHSSTAAVAHFNKNKDILSDIIRFAADRNIKVVLLTTPVYHTYLENIDKEQLQLTVRSCEEMDIVNENVIYVNSLRDKDFTESDFYDADHLNEIGAKKLSLKLDSIINNWK